MIEFFVSLKTMYWLVPWLKTFHILSATFLFGTGIGSAYYMWRAHLTKNTQVIATTTKHVVFADWLFTTPTVFIQPLSGLLMVHIMGYSWTAAWLMWTYTLFIIAGLCWLPVVWIQIKVHKMAKYALENKTALPKSYYRLMWTWFILGWPAFMGIVVVFFLMVLKPN